MATADRSSDSPSYTLLTPIVRSWPGLAFFAVASTLEHPVNPSKQTAGTIKSNRRELLLLTDSSFFMSLDTATPKGMLIEIYNRLSQILIARAGSEAIQGHFRGD